MQLAQGSNHFNTATLCVTASLAGSVAQTLMLLLGGVEKHRLVGWQSCGSAGTYARSPRMRRASWMSLGMMVTRLAWMAARLVSSNRPTR